MDFLQKCVICRHDNPGPKNRPIYIYVNMITFRVFAVLLLAQFQEETFPGYRRHFPIAGFTTTAQALVHATNTAEQRDVRSITCAMGSHAKGTTGAARLCVADASIAQISASVYFAEWNTSGEKRL